MGYCEKNIDILKGEILQNIPLAEISGFPNHPFGVREDEEMARMVESVREFGVLSPAIVRGKSSGGYEMISGHRRMRACEVAGILEMPCVVRDVSDDEAVMLMVDSNLQRERVLPSEKAFAYRMKLEAMKRQGARDDLTSDPMGRKLRGQETAAIIGNDAGESRNQVRRYIRLTELIPEILRMVDDGSIGFRPAVEVSYLLKEEQRALLEMMRLEERTPSLAQVLKMKQLSAEGCLSSEVIFSVMCEEKPNERDRVTIPRSRLKAYFSDDVTPRQVEETIIKALDLYRQRQKRKERER